MEKLLNKMIQQNDRLYSLVCEIKVGLPPRVNPEPATAEVPEHVTTQWVIRYLDTVKSTFYKHVFKNLLFPVEKIGNRQYYLKSEVVALMVRHEKGAWTFSKLAKGKGKKGDKM